MLPRFWGTLKSKTSQAVIENAVFRQMKPSVSDWTVMTKIQQRHYGKMAGLSGRLIFFLFPSSFSGGSATCNFLKNLA